MVPLRATGKGDATPLASSGYLSPHGVDNQGWAQRRRSVRDAGAIQTVSSAAKVGGLLLLVVGAFVLGNASAGALAGPGVVKSPHWGGIGVALVAALWAYNGFQDMVCVSGEVRDPGRILPRSLLVGSLIVVIIYLAVNVAYLYVLPLGTLSASPLVAADVAVSVAGPFGAGAISFLVMISTFGALNGLALVNPRVFYAMALDGLLFRPLARVHPRYGTPHIAIISCTVVALLFVWVRSFEQLTEAFILGVFPFLALAAAGVPILRRKRSGLVRPYRMPGNWFIPAVFVAAVLWILSERSRGASDDNSRGCGTHPSGHPDLLVAEAPTCGILTPVPDATQGRP